MSINMKSQFGGVMRQNIVVPMICLVIGISGCATTRNIYPTISNYVGSTDFIKYKRIAVLPFVGASNAPESGQIAQGLTDLPPFYVPVISRVGSAVCCCCSSLF